LLILNFLFIYRLFTFTLFLDQDNNCYSKCVKLPLLSFIINILYILYCIPFVLLFLNICRIISEKIYSTSSILFKGSDIAAFDTVICNIHIYFRYTIVFIFVHEDHDKEVKKERGKDSKAVAVGEIFSEKLSLHVEVPFDIVADFRNSSHTCSLNLLHKEASNVK
jgi:hypothetical protein